VQRGVAAVGARGSGWSRRALRALEPDRARRARGACRAGRAIRAGRSRRADGAGGAVPDRPLGTGRAAQATQELAAREVGCGEAADLDLPSGDGALPELRGPDAVARKRGDGS